MSFKTCSLSVGLCSMYLVYVRWYSVYLMYISPHNVYLVYIKSVYNGLLGLYLVM